MTVLNSGISWCTGTLNLTVGCTHISAACDNCYADSFVNRGILRGRSRDFSELTFHEARLRDLPRFLPARNAAGDLEPKMVFVNSLSDFWHEKIPEDFIHRALDAFEAQPTIIFQILTKRPGRMRRIITARYGNRGVPSNFWIGATCEDNRVARALDILRATKDEAGDFTAFASIDRAHDAAAVGNEHQPVIAIPGLITPDIGGRLCPDFAIKLAIAGEPVKNGSAIGADRFENSPPYLDLRL
jgi:protein gp37